MHPADPVAVSESRKLWHRNQVERRQQPLGLAQDATQRRLQENTVIRAAEATGQPVVAVWYGADNRTGYAGRKVYLSLNPSWTWSTDAHGRPLANLRAVVDHHVAATLQESVGVHGYELMSVADAEKVDYESDALALAAASEFFS